MGIPKKSRKITKSLSVCKHEEKRVCTLVHQSTRTIGSLPKDLLIDVLARVASSSLTGLFSAKLSCKEFLESTKDDYIFQHISLDKFPVTEWSPLSQREYSFLSHCFIKGNPESLFRQGMIEYFKQVNVNFGLEFLKRAVEKGHSEATYVYGMILLSGGDQSSQHGLNLLNSMNCSRSRNWNVRECRDKIDTILSRMWINNRIALEKVNTKCQKRDHVIRFEKRGWSLDEDIEISSCHTCLWYRELVYFCRIMNVIV
ncbi:putative F-box protein [Helianthus anomalus]